MHLNYVRPPEDPGSTAFACGNVLIPSTFEAAPTELDGSTSDVGENALHGWASAWIDLGGEG
jgi:hypothetical protein